MRYREKENWGRALWAFIHTITIIDFEDNERFVEPCIDNLKALSGAIPCSKCVEHYIEQTKLLDAIDVNKPMVLFEWTVNLHNSVNRKLGKPEITYDEATQIWCRTVPS